jgi:hypothetical protein
MVAVPLDDVKKDLACRQGSRGMARGWSNTGGDACVCRDPRALRQDAFRRETPFCLGRSLVQCDLDEGFVFEFVRPILETLFHFLLQQAALDFWLEL